MRNETHEARLARLAFYRVAKRSPCVDCGGEFHPASLGFNPKGTARRADISTLAYNVQSLTRLVQAVAECEVVCANCQAVRVYNHKRFTE